MLSLFMAATGGRNWGEITDSLEDVSFMPVFVFLLYFGLVVFAVMNVMTGIFVDQSMKAADQDVERVVHEEQSTRQRVTQQLKELLNDADESDDGKITSGEMKKHLRNKA